MLGGWREVGTKPWVPLVLLTLDRDPPTGVPSHCCQLLKGGRQGCKPPRGPLCTPKQIIINQLAARLAERCPALVGMPGGGLQDGCPNYRGPSGKEHLAQLASTQGQGKGDRCLDICTHMVTDTRGHTCTAWPQASRHTLVLSLRDTRPTPDLGALGQGWCQCWVARGWMTKGVRCRYPAYPRDTPG